MRFIAVQRRHVLKVVVVMMKFTLIREMIQFHRILGIML